MAQGNHLLATDVSLTNNVATSGSGGGLCYAEASEAEMVIVCVSDGTLLVPQTAGTLAVVYPGTQMPILDMNCTWQLQPVAGSVLRLSIDVLAPVSAAPPQSTAHHAARSFQLRRLLTSGCAPLLVVAAMQHATTTRACVPLYREPATARPSCRATGYRLIPYRTCRCCARSRCGYSHSGRRRPPLQVPDATIVLTVVDIATVMPHRRIPLAPLPGLLARWPGRIVAAGSDE